MSFDKFWSVYPKHIAKIAAQNEWDKLSPDDEMQKRIMLAITEQKRYRDNVIAHNLAVPVKSRKILRDWPGPAAWLRDGRWDDEIPSINDLRFGHGEESKKEVCDCGKEGRFPFDGKMYCSRCYVAVSRPNEKHEVYDRLKSMGLGKLKSESKEQWIERIKSFCIEKRAVGSDKKKIP